MKQASKETKKKRKKNEVDGEGGHCSSTLTQTHTSTHIHTRTYIHICTHAGTDLAPARNQSEKWVRSLAMASGNDWVKRMSLFKMTLTCLNERKCVWGRNAHKAVKQTNKWFGVQNSKNEAAQTQNAHQCLRSWQYR